MAMTTNTCLEKRLTDEVWRFGKHLNGQEMDWFLSAKNNKNIFILAI